MVLVLGVILVVLMVLLNMIFIPWLGINGAGIATFLAVFVYNTIKLFFVYKKFKIFPFTLSTLKVGGMILIMIVTFYFWDFSVHPIINIVLKSTLITLVYVFAVYKFNFSDDLSVLIKRYLKL
jgi:O-antigen/teichoic acid export membrane protein